MQALIGQLQKAGKRVIASCHHFEGTPGSDVMKTVLEKMEAAGADIRKLAVMPHTSRDVLRLLAVTLDASEQGEAPLITMSMGALGRGEPRLRAGFRLLCYLRHHGRRLRSGAASPGPAGSDPEGPEDGITP